MDTTEIRLRLIEAAADLPGVRMGADHQSQAERARECAQVWYDFVYGGKESPRAQLAEILDEPAPKRETLTLRKRKHKAKG